MLKVQDLRGRPGRRERRAFTLLEALFASAILSIITLATIQSVTAGQIQSIAAQNQLIAVLVADSTLSEVAVTSYAQLPLLDGRSDAIGSLRTLSGAAYPASTNDLGRDITVVTDSIEFTDPPVLIRGHTATVNVRDSKRVLVSLSRFFPEPPQ